MDKIEIKVTVGNRMGLHARPAGCIAAIMADYTGAEVMLGRPDDWANAADCRSVLSLMILAAGQGTELLLTGSGDGAAEAVKRIEACFAANFDEGQ
jgi:phosphocarrier protein